MPPKTQFVEDFPIDKVKIPAGGREIRDIDHLMESIHKFGNLQNIGVTPEGTLIFGQRRFRAQKRLGKTTIPAVIIEGADTFEIALLTFEENSQRQELTTLEQWEQLVSLKELYERTYPATRKGNNKARHALKGNNITLQGFAKKFGRKGFGPKRIQQAVNIIKRIPVELRDQIRTSTIANSAKALTDLADELRPPKRKKALKKGKSNSSLLVKTERETDENYVAKTMRNFLRFVDGEDQYGNYYRIYDAATPEGAENLKLLSKTIEYRMRNWGNHDGRKQIA